MPDINDLPTVSSDHIISIRVPSDLNEKTENAAKATGLKKSDVIRLSIDRGVDILIAQLSAAPAEIIQGGEA
jgi:predicted DNA-binding protein